MIEIATADLGADTVAESMGKPIGPGWLYYSAMGLSAGLGVYSIIQLYNANNLYAEGRKNSNIAETENDRAAYYESVNQEEEAQQATQTGLAAAVIEKPAQGAGAQQHPEIPQPKS